jgi:hypothetical protein
MEFMELGAAETAFLLRINAIYRLVCATLSLNPLNQNLPVDKLRSCIGNAVWLCLRRPFIAAAVHDRVHLSLGLLVADGRHTASADAVAGRPPRIPQ